MKGKIVCILSAAVLLLIAAVLTSCDGLPTIDIRIDYADPTGTVTNAKTGQPVGSATVTLRRTSSGTANYTTTTNSSGYYSFSDVAAGEYELTAVKTGLAFTKNIVDVASNGSAALPQIGGFTPDAADAITIFVFWDGKYKDIDAHLTFPADDATANATLPTLASSDFYTPATMGSMDTTTFLPENATGRAHIYYLAGSRDWDADIPNYYTPASSAPADRAASEIYLDVDNTGAVNQPAGGPETITIRGLPYTDSIFNGTNIVANNVSYTATAGDPSGLDAGNYYWIGVMEYYINAFTNGEYLSTEGSPESADAVVYLFVGNTQKGVYTVPTYTGVKTASVLRINMFYGNDGSNLFVAYQFLPDIRAYAGPSSIRNVNGNPGIVTVRMPIKK